MSVKAVIDYVSPIVGRAFETGKRTCLYLGKEASYGYKHYIVPAALKINEVSLSMLKALGNFLKKGPGPVFAVASGLFMVGVFACTMADKKGYEGDALLKSIWKTVGIASFALSAVAAACGAIVISRT